MPVKPFKTLLNSKTFKTVKRDVNSPKFYREHPDLAPRNVYLREGRVITKKEVDRAMRQIKRFAAIEDFFDRVSLKLQQFKQLFRKKKIRN